MRVYHFVSRQYGLDDLRRRRLKIATIDDLNDPFELLALDLSQPQLRSAMRAVKADFTQRMGLLCFSKTWQNPVQWSHYAEKHRGLCIVFNVSEDSVRTVSYKRSRLTSEAQELARTGTTNHDTMIRLLSTKFHHWHYEQEVRAFLGLEERDPESGLFFADFSDKLKLVGVIVGAESTISKSELQEALGPEYSSIEQFKVRLAFRTFRVVRQADNSLWA